jgi:hypothetical protein
VAWPLTSLMPKISDCGKETDTLTFKLGVWGSASVTFSTCARDSQFTCVMSQRSVESSHRWRRRH